MFRLIIAIIAVPIILLKYYDWIIKKDKLDFKTILLLLLATIVMIQVIYEKLFPGGVEK